MMPVVSASGECGPIIFVVKQKLSYRNVLRGGVDYTETVAYKSPRNSICTTHESLSDVDSVNFFAWAEEFVIYTRGHTSKRKTSLLILDGHRAHMSLKCYKFLSGTILLFMPFPTTTQVRLSHWTWWCLQLWKFNYVDWCTSVFYWMSKHYLMYSIFAHILNKLLSKRWQFQIFRPVSKEQEFTYLTRQIFWEFLARLHQHRGHLLSSLPTLSP